MKNSCCTKSAGARPERSANSVWIPLPCAEGTDSVGVGTEVAVALACTGASSAPATGAPATSAPAASRDTESAIAAPRERITGSSSVREIPDKLLQSDHRRQADQRRTVVDAQAMSSWAWRSRNTV